MNNHDKQEKILLEVMHLIAAKYNRTAVLKGGMYLRLLNSPRFTNDIDYAFPTKISRKVILSDLERLCKNAQIQIEKKILSSRGFFLTIKKEDAVVAVEISIVKSLNCETEQKTTNALADKFQEAAQIVTVMALSEAYSNKIAASLERNLIRDLYDIAILEPLTPFDVPTLKNRLDNLQVARQKPTAITFQKAAKRLNAKAKDLKKDAMQNQLDGLVAKSFLTGGGEMIIKSSVMRLCQQLAQIK